MKKQQEKNQEGQAGFDESGLKDLFLDELKDIYWAEKHLAKALPKMAKSATSDELRSDFEQHLTETESQIQSLEEFFYIICLL